MTRECTKLVLKIRVVFLLHSSLDRFLHFVCWFARLITKQFDMSTVKFKTQEAWL